MIAPNVDDPAFWKARLDEIHRKDWLFLALWDTSVEIWKSTLQTHKEVLAQVITKPSYVLDAGCGMGHLTEILPETVTAYMGVDLSPDFITYCRNKRPDFNFRCHNLRSLPFESGTFDYAVCRSMEGMISARMGDKEWKLIEDELHRVAKTVIILNYTQPAIWRETTVNTLPGKGITPTNLETYLKRTAEP
jgi:SAM-dependent methyltransferase